jgi:hypothetical protein
MLFLAGVHAKCWTITKNKQKKLPRRSKRKKKKKKECLKETEKEKLNKND